MMVVILIILAILLGIVVMFLGITAFVTSMAIGMDGDTKTPFLPSWIECMKQFLGKS